MISNTTTLPHRYDTGGRKSVGEITRPFVGKAPTMNFDTPALIQAMRTGPAQAIPTATVKIHASLVQLGGKKHTLCESEAPPSTQRSLVHVPASRSLVLLLLFVALCAAPFCAQDEEVRFRHLVQAQAARYPLMELQDVYKLIHQAAMGSEHAVSDTAAAYRWMEREIATLADGPDDPLLDPLTPDSQLVRVHLRPYLAGGGDPDALVRAFVETANTYPGSVERLRRYWRYAERSAEAGLLPFSPDAMTAFLAEQAEAGYPAVHHSARYEAAYAPAYRVVARQHLGRVGNGQ